MNQQFGICNIIIIIIKYNIENNEDKKRYERLFDRKDKYTDT